MSYREGMVTWTTAEDLVPAAAEAGRMMARIKLSPQYYESNVAALHGAQRVVAVLAELQDGVEIAMDIADYGYWILRCRACGATAHIPAQFPPSKHGVHTTEAGCPRKMTTR